MGRKSDILKLPSEVRQCIATLREEGRILDDIVEAIEAEFNVKVSRSSLHRYTKSVDKVTEQIRKSRYMAESVAKHFGDKPASDIARTNIELLHSLILDIMVCDEDGDGKIDMNSGDAMKIAIALEKLTKAHKTDTERELKIREEAAKEARIQAAKNAVKVGKKEGLTAATVEAIKGSILGVK